MSAQTTAEMMRTPDAVVPDLLAPFEHPEIVGTGNALFREGEQPRGVYVVRDGTFDLLYASKLGDSRPLRTAGAGQILGLSCVVSDRPHDCSATARTPCTVGFIARDDFKRLLDEKPELWFAVLQMISSDINACWDCMRTLARC